MSIEQQVQQELWELQDTEYKKFHAKLMPTIDPDTIIGVRTPALRSYAKQFAKTQQCQQFLENLPHQYYEENNLQGFVIEGIKDYDACMEKIERFLPYIDNWATCDLMSPKVFKKHREELLEKIRVWIRAEHIYTIRFGIKMLMAFYLDEAFEVEYLDLVASIHSEEYYVNMMIAWFFATALAKQYDATVPYVQERKLEQWTHSKTISKAVDSYRITAEQKIYLKTLRWK